MTKELFLLLAALVSYSVALPLWKVFCTTTPLFRGRADPIVEPGVISQHSHKVWGGNNFGLGATPVDPVAYYNLIRASTCTTCSISLDLSNYWTPDLYYEWPNGTLELVPNGGLTVYYPSRGGTGNQTHPDLQPFPKGFRMTSGNPFRRSYNASSNADKAISFACIGVDGPETPYFPTDTKVCSGGLRAQVWFPTCWDGVNVDSPDHQSHMSFPIERPDGGNCPASHPVRLPGVFYEVLFDVNPTNWPHGQGYNPFRLSCGDSTGYGFHGDFLSGWDVDLVRAALKDPMCDDDLNPNLDAGNNVKACPPMAPYVQDPDNSCMLAKKIDILEDLGFAHPFEALPGCNPITGEQPDPVIPCKTARPASPIPAPYRRVLFKSVLTGLYLTVASLLHPTVFANASSNVDDLSPTEAFILTPNWWNSDGGSVILSEQSGNYLTAPNGGSVAMTADRRTPSDWEVFFFNFSTDGSKVSILANSNSKWVAADPKTMSIFPNAKTVSDAATFYIIDTGSITQDPPPQQDVPSVAPPPGQVYDSSEAYPGNIHTGSAAALGVSLASLAMAAILML